MGFCPTMPIKWARIDVAVVIAGLAVAGLS